MNLSQEFTQHYMTMEPEEHNTEYDFSSHREQNSTQATEQPSNIVIFPVIRSESWRQVRMEAQ